MAHIVPLLEPFRMQLPTLSHTGTMGNANQRLVAKLAMAMHLSVGFDTGQCESVAQVGGGQTRVVVV
jgi:acid phosphatase family membrane protein YuiD